MKDFKDSDGKFHPITQYKSVRKLRDTTVKRTGVKLTHDMFKDSKLIHKARLKDYDHNAKIYNAKKFDDIDVSDSLRLDTQWNLMHPKESFFLHGDNKGHPSVDYLGLMKKMEISNVDNWEQWKYDGQTDKEIFDLFLRYANAEASYDARMSRDRQKTKLENRANTGIRAYTKEFTHDGRRLVLEIGTHMPMGKYIIEPYWRNYPLDREQEDIVRELHSRKFRTFNDAKDFIEKRFGLDIELDRVGSNDNRTWEENISMTDRELPYSRIFWSLPEDVAREKNIHETMESFIKRKGLDR